VGNVACVVMEDIASRGIEFKTPRHDADSFTDRLKLAIKEVIGIGQWFPNFLVWLNPYFPKAPCGIFKITIYLDFMTASAGKSALRCPWEEAAAPRGSNK